MLSYDVVEHGKPLQAVVRETPVPKGREVLLRVTHSGLCHSDIHLWNGYFDLGGGKKAMLSARGVRPPITMGHEPLGVVVACGPDVQDAKVGDKRLVFPWVGCGQCWACDKNLTTLCIAPKGIGVAVPGGFSTHLVVPDAKYLVDVDGIDDAFAATLSCSGVTSYSAIKKLPPLVQGDYVAVIGCGGVGLLAISALRALGISNIIGCDVDDAKLESARSMGAEKTVRVDATNGAEVLAAHACGRLAGVIDFVGTPNTFQFVYPAMRKGAGYVLCGLHGGELTLAMPPIAQRAISITGSYVGTLEDLQAVVDLARTGALRYSPVTTRPASEINAALDDLHRGRVVGRTVLDFQGTVDPMSLRA